MDILSGLKVYYAVSGIRGVAILIAHRMLGWPATITVSHPTVKHLVTLRVRTSDVSLFRDIVLQCEYDFPLAFTPRTIVDAGANCGMAAIFLANKFPAAHIVAIEPEPSNFVALTKNVAPYANISTMNAALWSEDGELGVFDVNGGKWAFRTRPGNGCRAVSIPTVMKENNLESIDLLKVDVEGAEKEIFLHCDWMDRVRILAIEFHDRFEPGCRAVVEEKMTGLEFVERGELNIFGQASLLFASTERHLSQS